MRRPVRGRLSATFIPLRLSVLKVIAASKLSYDLPIATSTYRNMSQQADEWRLHFKVFFEWGPFLVYDLI